MEPNFLGGSGQPSDPLANPSEDDVLSRPNNMSPQHDFLGDVSVSGEDFLGGPSTSVEQLQVACEKAVRNAVSNAVRKAVTGGM